jgi:low temperature requirement protein LtrA
MASDNPRGALFRARQPNQRSRVTNAELLFDLVFVFAVTQISHFLLSRFTAVGAIETALLALPRCGHCRVCRAGFLCDQAFRR